MFMISRFMFDAAYRDKGYFRINPYNPDNHINNFYYFRLGGVKKNDTVTPLADAIVIEPRAFLRIWTLETFEPTQINFSEGTLAEKPLYNICVAYALIRLQHCVD